MNKSKTVYSCRDVWKLFGEKPEEYIKTIGANANFESLRQDGYIAAVRNVTLDIYANEILVIMGLSGSGKSTFVRCLSRLIDITSGIIEIEGQDIMGLDEKELIDLRRNKMGMVFQSFGLLPHRTVLDNVAFPLEMRGQDVHTRNQRAMDVINLVGLNGRETYFPHELSGGQQQRVGIARSLAVEPDIWFLDEPFSALDPLIRREMQDEFLRLQGILGKTIVFITHDFDEAIRLADRIAIMKDGAVEQIDVPDQIVLNPKTDYVARFVKDVSKSKLVHVGAISKPLNNHKVEGEPLPADVRLHQVARQLFDDSRDLIPVSDDKQNIVGVLSRSEAMNLIFDEFQ